MVCSEFKHHMYAQWKCNTVCAEVTLICMTLGESRYIALQFNNLFNSVTLGIVLSQIQSFILLCCKMVNSQTTLLISSEKKMPSLLYMWDSLHFQYSNTACDVPIMKKILPTSNMQTKMGYRSGCLILLYPMMLLVSSVI